MTIQVTTPDGKTEVETPPEQEASTEGKPEGGSESAPESEGDTEQKPATESEPGATEENKGTGEPKPEPGKEEPTDGDPPEGDPKEGDPDPEEGKGEPGKEEKPKKAKGGFQRKINKLTARQKELERENEYLRKLALKDKEGAGDKDTPPEQAAPETEQKPNQDNFETHEEWVEAVADWKAEQKFAKFKSEQEKARIKSEQDTRVQNYLQRRDKFIDTVEDWEEAMDEVADIEPSATLEQTLLESDLGPQLAYELAKDREAYERINALPPIAAAREIGKIEARILSTQSSEGKPETKAKTKSNPDPINPVRTSKGSGVEKSIYDEDLSQAEYERIREKQIAARNTR